MMKGRMGKKRRWRYLEVTGTLQHIQQTQQSLSSVAQHQHHQHQQQFQAPGGLVNKQYNSPLPLYSQENVQEVVRMQAGGRSPAQAVNPAASSSTTSSSSCSSSSAAATATVAAAAATSTADAASVLKRVRQVH
ncbi:hypothetical protein Pcinc_013898 [Petrolisthes cinctipes]|uniref:Zasp-like motif domain-containing protein n=1 Tax=Petrolisthes cinctipes TaxID=88211 RepID=A0AAE1KR73_PETCI|nr:hypothetical protein Pcinc_013898 [Petrolisthes cinctipes]